MQSKINNDPTYKLAIVSRDYRIYESCFQQAISTESSLANNYELIYSGKSATLEVLKHAEVILSEPDIANAFLQDCTSVKWVQSTWAGNNALQSTAELKYILTGVKGIFASQMTEYVMAYLLYFSRRINEFTELQQAKTWSQLECSTLQGKTLGVLGFGNIGRAVASTAESLGLNCIGLARTANSGEKTKIYAIKDIFEFARNCDFVVNLLPETEQTIGLCDAQFFQSMKASSIFINAGRGSVIRSSLDLIDALNSGNLKAAVLDVFKNEPLPSSHPYYEQKNIYLTCHTAAMSQPTLVFDVFAENAQLFAQNKPLKFVHDFSKGY